MTPSPEIPRAQPSLRAELNSLAKQIERVPTPERLKDLNAEVLAQAIPRVEAANTVAPEQVEEARRDLRRLGLFETLALAFALLLKRGFQWDQTTLDSFLEVEDDTTQDVEPEKQPTEAQTERSPKARRQARRDRRQTRRPEQRERTSGDRLLVQSATSLVGSTRFRGPEVAGGTLACAQVATTALVEAGYLKKPILSVASTRQELVRRGWKAHRGPGRPGDVVIWNRTQKSTNDGQVKLGHAHIGIVVGPNRCVSNSSSKKTPRLHNMGENAEDGYWHQRGIDTYLSPPTA